MRVMSLALRELLGLKSHRRHTRSHSPPGLRSSRCCTNASSFSLQHVKSPVNYCSKHDICTHTHTHTRLTALFLGLPGWAGTRKVKPIWILLKQETVSGSGISWATCKSAPRSRQITTPAPHRSVFYRPDSLPAAQPTASKHWRQICTQCPNKNKTYNFRT